MTILDKKDFKNIPFNQLLYFINNDTKIRVIDYISDEVVIEKTREKLANLFFQCDFDVVYIENINNVMEVTINTKI